MKTAIQFSGGKDSLAVLYLNRSRLNDPDVTVYFGDTGIVYPHMKAFVLETCKKLGATLKIVTPKMPIGEYHARFGLPSDIVPVEASFQTQSVLADKRPQLLQSYLTCCGNMLWAPMEHAIREDGNTSVIRGSKKCDGHVGVEDGHTENGVTYHSPLWNWTDADVFQYLREVGAELPEHYAEVNNSFDCLFCTAFLTSEGAQKRLEWTRKHYPEQWPAIRANLQTVKTVLDSEREMISEALDIAEE